MNGVVVPDVAEPVTAYRAFNLDADYPADKPRLKAVAGYGIWLPGANEATCHGGSRMRGTFVGKNINGEFQVVYEQDTYEMDEAHTLIPDPRCDCGFWMLNSFDDLMGRYRLQEDRIYARVQAWGRLVRGTQGQTGYRAQYAKVIEFLARPMVETVNPSGVLDALAVEYNAPWTEDEQTSAYLAKVEAANRRAEQERKAYYRAYGHEAPYTYGYTSNHSNHVHVKAVQNIPVAPKPGELLEWAAKQGRGAKLKDILKAMNEQARTLREGE